MIWQPVYLLGIFGYDIKRAMAHTDARDDDGALVRFRVCSLTQADLYCFGVPQATGT